MGTENKPLTILSISGSLKSTSSNTNILRAIAKLAPTEVTLNLYEGLGDIPPFSPEREDGIESVVRLRQLIAEADGVIIATPEYAFGVPGVLKNALDWTVSTGEFNEKPVTAISASPLNSGGDKALASLLLTLTALGTEKSGNSSLSIPNLSKKFNKEGQLTDEQTLNELKAVLDDLIKRIREKK
jgi:chromate reductase